MLRRIRRYGFYTAARRRPESAYPLGDMQIYDPTVEYSFTEKGKTLIPALDTLYQWADDQMKAK